MKTTNSATEKIFSPEEIIRQASRWRLKSKSIVFTNGVFDLLHKGHIFSLSQAAAEGDVLVVGVNSDASVKRLKGESRPVNDEETRLLLLSSLSLVDAVVLFNEDTPLELIKSIMPDVIVKGGDYAIEEIAGAKEVIENGGRVVLAKLVEGVSTTNTIQRLK